MIVTTLLAILFACYAHGCQMTSNNPQCNMAMEDFNDSYVCKVAYEEIVSERDPNCTSSRVALCQDLCLQPAKTISCSCHGGSMITDNIGRICDCAANISCPFPPDNCSRTIDTFQCNEQCQDAYLSLLTSNGTSSSSCHSLCDAECMKLLQNVSCHCSEMSQGDQIIRNIETMCSECSVMPCSGIGRSLLSLWILVISLVVAMVTW